LPGNSIASPRAVHKGESDRHCHPPLMSFIGKAATVSVVFLLWSPHYC
jgi:hypothetical protein